MNIARSNSHQVIEGQRTCMNILGNNNLFEITNSEITITVNGNHNVF